MWCMNSEDFKEHQLLGTENTPNYKILGIDVPKCVNKPHCKSEKEKEEWMHNKVLSLALN